MGRSHSTVVEHMLCIRRCQAQSLSSLVKGFQVERPYPNTPWRAILPVGTDANDLLYVKWWCKDEVHTCYTKRLGLFHLWIFSSYRSHWVEMLSYTGGKWPCLAARKFWCCLYPRGLCSTANRWRVHPFYLCVECRDPGPPFFCPVLCTGWDFRVSGSSSFFVVVESCLRSRLELNQTWQQKKLRSGGLARFADTCWCSCSDPKQSFSPFPPSWVCCYHAFVPVASA